MSTPATYQLSKDYNALYDFVCAGGEALGYVRDPDRPVWGFPDERNPVSIQRMNDDDPLVWVIGDRFQHRVAVIATVTQESFIAECQRLSLEWLPPHPPAPRVLSDEEIALIANDAFDRHVDAHRQGFTEKYVKDLEQCRYAMTGDYRFALRFARDHGYLSPVPMVVGEDPYRAYQSAVDPNCWLVRFGTVGPVYEYQSPIQAGNACDALNAAYNAGRGASRSSGGDLGESPTGTGLSEAVGPKTDQPSAASPIPFANNPDA